METTEVCSRRAGTAVIPYISASCRPVIWYLQSVSLSCPASKRGIGFRDIVGSTVADSSVTAGCARPDSDWALKYIPEEQTTPTETGK